MKKKILVAAAMVAVAIGMQAQGIIINKTDGTFEVFPADEVVSIVTYGYGEEPQPGEGNTASVSTWFKLKAARSRWAATTAMPAPLSSPSTR